MPDHRHLGAARRVHLGHRQAAARGVDPGRRVEPDQHARDGRGDPGPRRRRHGVDGAPVPRRPGVGRARPRAAAATRSTPASAATRPAWTTPSRTRSPAAWSTRAPGHETELVLLARPAAPSASPWSAPARPASPPPSPRPSAGTPSSCSRPSRRDRRAVPPRPPHPGQGGVRRDAALLHPPARAHRRQGAPRSSGDARAELVDGGYDDVVLATGVSRPRPSAIAGRRPARTCTPTPTSSPARRTVGARVAVIGAGGIGFDVSEFLTHAGAQPSRSRARTGCASGASATRPTTRGGLVPRPAPRRPPRQVFLLQRKTSKVGAGLGKTSGLGAPRHAAAPRRRDAQRRHLRAHRRRRPAHHRRLRAAAAAVLEVDDVVICAGQEPRRDLLDELQAAGVARARHRRRRRGRRARRQARDRPGHAARRRPLGPAVRPQAGDRTVDGRCTTPRPRGTTASTPVDKM